MYFKVLENCQPVKKLFDFLFPNFYFPVYFGSHSMCHTPKCLQNTSVYLSENEAQASGLLFLHARQVTLSNQHLKSVDYNIPSLSVVYQLNKACKSHCLLILIICFSSVLILDYQEVPINQLINQVKGIHYPNANQLNCPQLALYINFTSFVHQFSSKKMMGCFFPILQVAEALFSILTNNFLVNILLSSASLLSPG